MNSSNSNTSSNTNKPLSPLQWLKDNDIIILILVGIVTLACTGFASHLHDHHIQPCVQKITGYKTSDKPNTGKLFLQFLLILFIVYLIVEFVLRPSSPMSYYLLPTAVSEARQEQESQTLKSTQQYSSTGSVSTCSFNPKLLNTWSDSFRVPAKHKRAQWPYPYIL